MRLQLIFLLLVFVISCKDKDPGICGVDDPANDLPWLKELIEFKKTDGGDEARGMAYIMQAELEGNVVFYDGVCCPACDYVVTFYDCSGSELNLHYVETYPQLKNSKLVWTHENSLCLFY